MMRRFLIVAQLIELAVLVAISIPLARWAGWPAWGVFLFVLAGFFVLRATIIGYSVVLAGLFDLKEKPLEPRGSRLAATWREIVAYQRDYVFAQSFSRLPDRRNGTGLPVVLVHGYICNREIFNRMQKKLRRKIKNPIYAVTLEPMLGDIDVIAADLARQLDTILERSGANRCVLVVHSMGGLVARALIRNGSRNRLAGLVTIATPHAGTKLESHGPGKNARQMRPGNQWLNALPPPPDGLKLLMIATGRDNLIVPRRSAVMSGGEQCVVPGVAHISLLSAPKTVAAVAGFIRQIDVLPR